MRDIKKALQEHKEKVIAAGYSEKQILGIFVYGSQNYGLATDKSDVDTKAVLIPTLEQLALHPIKTRTLELENGEHCEIMDIAHLIQNFRKQNINFIEVLFTKYCWVNPFYKDLWDYYFIEQNEYIAHYDCNKCLQSISGQAIHTLNQNPFDGKKVGNGLRLYHFLISYLAGENYRNCITTSGKLRKEILDMKYQTLETDTKAKELVDNFKSLQSLIINPPQLYKGGPQLSQNAIDSKMEVGVMEMIRRNENG